jgi:hypothetical protein
MREPQPDDALRIHDALLRVIADAEMRSRCREIATQMSQLPMLAELSLT